MRLFVATLAGISTLLSTAQPTHYMAGKADTSIIDICPGVRLQPLEAERATSATTLSARGEYLFVTGTYRYFEPEEMAYPGYRFPYALHGTEPESPPVYIPKICGAGYLVPVGHFADEQSCWYGRYHEDFAYLQNDTVCAFHHPGHNGEFLAQLDDSGEVDWMLDFHSTDYFELRPHESGSDNGYYLSVVCRDTLYIRSPVETRTCYVAGNRSWLFKTDSGGRLTASRSFEELGIVSISEVLRFDDNNLFVCGSVEVPRPDPQDGYDRNPVDLVLVCLDSAFHIKWKKQWGGRYDEEFTSIQRCTDGNLLLSGYYQDSLVVPLVSDPGYVSPENKGEKSFFLMKMNPGGDVLSIQSFGLGWYDYVRKPLADGSGNFHIVGRFNRPVTIVQATDTLRLPHHSGEDVFYIKFTSEGLFTNPHVMGFNGNDRYYSVMQGPDDEVQFIFDADASWPKVFFDGSEYPIDRSKHVMMVRIGK